MQLDEVKSSRKPHVLKYPSRDVPHATIEPNRTCNIQCRCCYNRSRSYIKSFAEVTQEVDLVLSKRNLQTITLLGGEPTLHPQLKDIIAFIKSKNVICQLLTNGIILLQDKDDQYLHGLMSAGLDRILLHLDSGQNHVHHDLEDVRRILFEKLEKKKIHFSLSMTVYQEDRGTIPALVKKYSTYRYFDGVLAVPARASLLPQPDEVSMAEEYASISGQLKIGPTAYIPSNLDERFVSWLFYSYYINAGTKETFSISPFSDNLARKLYRRIKRKNLFTIKSAPAVTGLIFFFMGLWEVLIKPEKWRDFRKVLKNSLFLRAIRFHYIVIQNPPEFNADKNQIQICYSCPDATIRHNRLLPVCLADRISPLPGTVINDAVPEDVLKSIAFI